MNATERAAQVLQEIDEHLAMAEKATKGPWASSREDMDSFTTNPETGKTERVAYVYRNPHSRIGVFGKAVRRDSRFIAASRTGWPTALRCLKTAIEGLSGYADNWNNDNCLTALCDQWKAMK